MALCESVVTATADNVTHRKYLGAKSKAVDNPTHYNTSATKPGK